MNNELFKEVYIFRKKFSGVVCQQFIISIIAHHPGLHHSRQQKKINVPRRIPPRHIIKVPVGPLTSTLLDTGKYGQLDPPHRVGSSRLEKTNFLQRCGPRKFCCILGAILFEEITKKNVQKWALLASFGNTKKNFGTIAVETI